MVTYSRMHITTVAADRQKCETMNVGLVVSAVLGTVLVDLSRHFVCLC